VGILRRVSAPTADGLAEALHRVTAAPERTAIFCDVDGTLAPIVERAENAQVPIETARLLGALARRYACVACLSGRSATEARRLVGVGGIAYAGLHGAELLESGATEPRLTPAVAGWSGRVRRFATAHDSGDLRRLRVRLEDKDPIFAFHWRGAPDEDAAQAAVERVAEGAERAGLHVHWGRKVLEVRPPVRLDKGEALRDLAGRAGVRAALFGGDDVTDLDAFDALDALVSDGALDVAVRVGVRSDDGPAEIIERADIVVDGVPGFAQVLAALAEA
jgi:trehalose 6-phosphate phosphatase